MTCPILFIHGQKDSLIPFEHTLKLKENCSCPYEVLLPEDMDHNIFDFELDFIIPIKDFFRRHTGLKDVETSETNLPQFFFRTPSIVSEYIEKMRGNEIVNRSSSCLCGTTEDK